VSPAVVGHNQHRVPSLSKSPSHTTSTIARPSARQASRLLLQIASFRIAKQVWRLGMPTSLNRAYIVETCVAAKMSSSPSRS
jgi:hypothetical protein